MPYRDEPDPHEALFASIRIATPCDASWDAMAGDDRVRHCGLCDKKVYDLAMLTRAEIAALLRDHDELPCARLSRRADGRLITADCPRGQRTRKRRLTLVAAACAGAAAVASAVSAMPEAPSRASPRGERMGELLLVGSPVEHREVDFEAFLHGPPQPVAVSAGRQLGRLSTVPARPVGARGGPARLVGGRRLGPPHTQGEHEVDEHQVDEHQVDRRPSAR